MVTSPTDPRGPAPRARIPSLHMGAPSAPLAVLQGSVGPCIQILFGNFLSSCRVTAPSSPIPKQLKEGVWTPVAPKGNGLRDFWSV